MEQNHYIVDDSFLIDDNQVRSKRKRSIIYEIMHKEKTVATVSVLGKAKIYLEKFMPYDLYLEDPGPQLVRLLYS